MAGFQTVHEQSLKLQCIIDWQAGEKKLYQRNFILEKYCSFILQSKSSACSVAEGTKGGAENNKI